MAAIITLSAILVALYLILKTGQGKAFKDVADSSVGVFTKMITALQGH
jgi:hypothetical protein